MQMQYAAQDVVLALMLADELIDGADTATATAHQGARSSAISAPAVPVSSSSNAAVSPVLAPKPAAVYSIQASLATGAPAASVSSSSSTAPDAILAAHPHPFFRTDAFGAGKELGMWGRIGVFPRRFVLSSSTDVDLFVTADVVRELALRPTRTVSLGTERVLARRFHPVRFRFQVQAPQGDEHSVLNRSVQLSAWSLEAAWQQLQRRMPVTSSWSDDFPPRFGRGAFDKMKLDMRRGGGIAYSQQQFTATGTLAPSPTPVDRSNPLHPFYSGESGPSPASQLPLHRQLHEVTLENTFESCNTLRTALAAELGVVVCKSTVRRWLHALGYQCGKKHFVNQARSYAVKQHLAPHPEINTTVPQLMDDAGYELLYTPPYVSDLQPIEMIWASQNLAVPHTRSAVQTREAMERVTADLCKKQIAHRHAWTERFMQSEEGGSLEQFATLAALKPLAAALTHIDDLAPAAAPDAKEDDEDEAEAGSKSVVPSPSSNESNAIRIGFLIIEWTGNKVACCLACEYSLKNYLA